jgi:hypothetical protein
MKKYILSFLFISNMIYAQDYTKLKSPQLVDSIIKKDKTIKELEKTISELRNQAETLNKKNSFNNLEKYKNIIKDDNNYWLKDLFDKKYTDAYFLENDLEIEDITQKINKSNVYINSIKSVEENGELIEKCNRAIEFNENYLTLYTILNTVLNKKYNEKNVNDAIISIEKLPKLLEDSKLDKSKTRIKNILKNYLHSTCSLKKKLDGLKNADCKSPPMQKLFTSLENDDSYKGYVYLVKVIRKMKINKIDYTNDDLQPCEEVKTTTTDSEKSDGVKESTPPIVEEQKKGK